MTLGFLEKILQNPRNMLKVKKKRRKIPRKIAEVKLRVSSLENLGIFGDFGVKIGS